MDEVLDMRSDEIARSFAEGVIASYRQRGMGAAEPFGATVAFVRVAEMSDDQRRALTIMFSQKIQGKQMTLKQLGFAFGEVLAEVVGG